jgi:glycerol-3-phosphate acyltransferase PlsX
MRIAVDAMGGDHAPRSVIEGAILAAPQCSADLTLVGDEARISEVLGQVSEGHGLEIVHAPEVIGMEESGPAAVRKKREASLSVAMRMLAESKVDAVVSAGNSSAIVATAKHFAGMLPGLRRPALAVPIPTPFGEVLLMDGGAHAEADAIHLVQSAVMADAYLKVASGLHEPRIGLLNIGQESTKGTRVLQRAFALLKHTRIRFIGNIEPQDLFADRTDAVICDGFIGNILLKFFEGISEAHLGFFEKFLNERELSGEDSSWQSFCRFQRRRHYQSIGGAPLLGVRNTVVVAHGRSEGPAIANAIRLTHRLGESRVFELMSEELQKDSTLTELKHYYALWMLDHWKSKWGFAPKN